jgi:hypothetical protein
MLSARAEQTSKEVMARAGTIPFNNGTKDTVQQRYRNRIFSTNIKTRGQYSPSSSIQQERDS